MCVQRLKEEKCYFSQPTRFCTANNSFIRGNAFAETCNEQERQKNYISKQVSDYVPIPSEQWFNL